MEDFIDSSALGDSIVLGRRNFIGYVGAGLLASTFKGVSANLSLADDPKKVLSKDDKTPVSLKPIHHPTEAKEGELFAPVNPAKKIGYALVGLGHLTLEEILPAFAHSKYARPVALVSGDAAKAKKVARQYGIAEKNVYNYENFNNIKNNPEIDVVYIVLPNSMHHEFTIRAAEAGKHVLCEKPMAALAKECEEMIAACKKADRKLMIAYRIQYEPYNNKCREFVQSKEFGNVKLMEFYNGQNSGILINGV